MFYYKLFFRKQANGPLLGSEEILARDDVEAVHIASARAGRQTLELWCDKRKVKEFPPVDRDQPSFAFEAR